MLGDGCGVHRGRASAARSAGRLRRAGRATSGERRAGGGAEARGAEQREDGTRSDGQDEPPRWGRADPYSYCEVGRRRDLEIVTRGSERWERVRRGRERPRHERPSGGLGGWLWQSRELIRNEARLFRCT
jgi:hypothetical protein